MMMDINNCRYVSRREEEEVPIHIQFDLTIQNKESTMNSLKVIVSNH